MNEIHEIAKVFLKSGSISFGGPAAHIDMMGIWSTATITTFLNQINGLTGAIVSTIGIFLPSFIFVAVQSSCKKMRNSILFSAFLDAVNVASISIIIAICYQLGKDAINSALVVLGGSLAGYILKFI